jgi:hypothetical protein
MSGAAEPVGPPEFGDTPGVADAPGAPDEAPTQHLVAGTVGDRCVSCGTPLTSDQRYCVNCGERRGKARFTLPASDAPTSESLIPSPPPPPRAPRASSGTTIIAGVGTLLLAMGVGVLIGRDSSNMTNKTVAAAPTVVTVAGGAASGASTTTNSAPTGKTSSKSKGKSKGKSSKGKPSAAQAAKASQAASKVLGSSKALPPATVTEGQTGSGPGFNKKSHKFDGSFFGQ